MNAGWKEMKTVDGKVYYVNHATKSNSWERPVAAPVPSKPNGEQIWHVRLGSAFRRSTHGGFSY